MPFFARLGGVVSLTLSEVLFSSEAHSRDASDPSLLAFFSRLFNTDFMPHGHCYFWRKDMVLLHSASDLGIALAYYLIPLIVLFLVRKRHDVPFQRIFYLFAAFIFLCGTTHLTGVLTLWTPVYRFDGVLKALTAAVSLVTAFSLIPLVPKALALRSPSELEAKNRELEEEIQRRKEAETALSEAHRKLGLESQAALEKSRELLQTIIDNTAAFIYVKDDQGRFLRVNRALSQAFPVPGGLIGKSDADLFAHEPAYADSIRRNDLQVLQSELPQEFEETIPHGVGLKTFQSVKFSAPLERGKRGICGVSVDVTEKIRTIRKLNEKTRELERSNDELARFAFVASHDLKEPLRAISNYAQLLEKQQGEALGENARLCVRYIVEGVRRMHALIDDLLRYSQLGADRRKVEEFACAEAVQSALANLEVSIREHGARITVDALPRVCGDQSELVQLFQNLVGNALKYRSQAPPTVRVTCTLRDGQWCFAVRDNGIGIAPEFHEKIFVLFQRLHTDDAGTGIGLAICKKIVERHGGRMWIESQVGEGSTFYFTLPAQRREEGGLLP